MTVPPLDLEAILQTARLRLEPLQVHHAALLFEDLRDPRIYRFIPQDPPTSVEALEARYGQLRRRRSPDGRDHWLNWVMQLRQAGVYVGTLEATVYPDGSADIAYSVFPKFWGSGYGKEGCARMLAYLFDQGGITVARAAIDTRNTRSIKLVERLGFHQAEYHEGADFFKGSSSDEYRYEISIKN